MDNENIARRYWWLLLVIGLVGIAAGIAAIVWPHVTVAVIAVIFGVYLLIAGIVELVAGIVEDHADSGIRVLSALLGVLSLIAGVIVIRHPGQSLTVVAIVLGIYLIVLGVLTIFRGFETSHGRGISITVGVLDLIVGIIIAAWPSIGLTTLAVFVGIVLIVRGVATAWLAFVARKGAIVVTEL